MPSLVNRLPPGLLSLLGIKALGVNPSILPDELTPNLDVTALYLNGNAESVSGATNSVTADGVFTVAATLVPAGELWVVNSAALYSTAALAAGTTYTFSLGLWESYNSRVVRTGPIVSATAGQRPYTAIDGPFILTPGDQLALFCQTYIAGTARAFVCSARITRLLI